jgi:hypothetical protein
MTRQLKVYEAKHKHKGKWFVLSERSAGIQVAAEVCRMRHGDMTGVLIAETAKGTQVAHMLDTGDERQNWARRHWPMHSAGGGGGAAR